MSSPLASKLARAILVALTLLAAGCQLDEPTIGGTIVSVVEAERADDLRRPEESEKRYEDPLVPEVAWKLEVQLDNGGTTTVTHQGLRRYAPGERVRLLINQETPLLL